MRKQNPGIIELKLASLLSFKDKKIKSIKFNSLSLEKRKIDQEFLLKNVGKILAADGIEISKGKS